MEQTQCTEHVQLDNIECHEGPDREDSTIGDSRSSRTPLSQPQFIRSSPNFKRRLIDAFSSTDIESIDQRSGKHQRAMSLKSSNAQSIQCTTSNSKIQRQSTSWTSTPLTAFLNLRKHKTKSSFLSHITQPTLSKQIEGKFSEHNTSTSNIAQPVQTKPFRFSDLISAQSSLEHPRTIILNDLLFQSHASLATFLDRQELAGLTVIHRDFNQQIENAPDIILNPRTCIVYTTLQHLGQKPLPGQPRSATTSVHQRLTTLQPDFDKILIVVSHYVSSANPSDPSISDCPTIRTFTAFCASLSSHDATTITPLFILHSTPDDLAISLKKMTWRLVVGYAFPSLTMPVAGSPISQPLRFVQEETTWDVFLRRAGVNVMAAQVILSALRGPCGRSETSESGTWQRTAFDNSDDSASWGLPRLIRMPASQRTAMFAGLLGEKVIQRLNNVLDNHPL